MRNWICYIHIYIFFCLCRWLVVHKEIKYDIQVTGLLSFVFTSFIHSDAHTEFSNEMFFLSINATPEHHRQPLKASSLFQWWQNINWLCIVYGTSERKSSICLYGLFKFSSKMKCSFLSHIDERKKNSRRKNKLDSIVNHYFMQIIADVWNIISLKMASCDVVCKLIWTFKHSQSPSISLCLSISALPLTQKTYGFK